ncbi:491_t:CDS:2 [Dentiscutata heterogama]|uniref:491_t:CDS:1 n=1 Tax=Dentiscutata heterogama TaxID=1316150 RepID=A0ACA9LQ57_9GLOM|nr:491_t:CDS:2 [Dentiscutata heterogama]
MPASLFIVIVIRCLKKLQLKMRLNDVARPKFKLRFHRPESARQAMYKNRIVICDEVILPKFVVFADGSSTSGGKRSSPAFRVVQRARTSSCDSCPSRILQDSTTLQPYPEGEWIQDVPLSIQEPNRILQYISIFERDQKCEDSSFTKSPPFVIHEYIKGTKWKDDKSLIQKLDSIDAHSSVSNVSTLHIPKYSFISTNVGSNDSDIITLPLFIVVIAIGFGIWFFYGDLLYIIYRMYILNDLSPTAVKETEQIVD